jgi:hypothetical protein
MDDDKRKIRRGEIIGQPIGWKPKSEADHYAHARPAAPGSTCATSVKYSTTSGHCRIRRATSRRNSAALFLQMRFNSLGAGADRFYRRPQLRLGDAKLRRPPPHLVRLVDVNPGGILRRALRAVIGHR